MPKIPDYADHNFYKRVLKHISYNPEDFFIAINEVFSHESSEIAALYTVFYLDFLRILLKVDSNLDKLNYKRKKENKTNNKK